MEYKRGFLHGTKEGFGGDDIQLRFKFRKFTNKNTDQRSVIWVLQKYEYELYLYPFDWYTIQNAHISRSCDLKIQEVLKKEMVKSTILLSMVTKTKNIYRKIMPTCSVENKSIIFRIEFN